MEHSLDAVELIKIIEACKVAGVSYLKHGAMEIKFQSGEAAKHELSLTPPTDQELKEVETVVTRDRNFEEIEDELAVLQIENPSLFEELLVERELDLSGKKAIND